MSLASPVNQQINTAIQLINQKRFQQAQDIINSLITATPNNAQLWHLRSITNQALGQIGECEASLNKALNLSPKHIPALTNLARLQTQKNELTRAITTYKKIIKFESNNLSALYNLGVLLNRSKSYREAQPYLQKANQLAPNDNNIRLALGQSYLNQEMFAEALKFFNQILATAPNNIAALNNKGIVLKKQCNWSDAIQVLQRALSIAPQQAEIIKNLASCYTLIGEYEKSKALYNKAIELSPLDSDAHHWLNQMLYEDKDPEFLSSYKKSIQQYPNAEQLMLDMAHKQNQAGDLLASKETLENALKLDKAHPTTLIELGVVLRELEDFEQSHQYLLEADKLHASNLLAKEELGKSYISLNEPEKALAIFNHLLTINPEQQGWWAYKTTALKLLGSSEYDYYCNYDHVLITTIDTPKGFSSLKEFNISLVETLREYHHAKTNPLDQSLVTGSQTSEKLFDYHVPIIQQLRQSFRDQTLPFLANLPKDANHPVLSKNTGDFTETDSWSVILHNTGFHKNHHHPAGWYSGPYYAQIPDIVKDNKDKQGWVKFGQPGFKMMQHLEPDIIVEPTEGMMVRFPSYFWHGTLPFHSPQERITVPGDIIPA